MSTTAAPQPLTRKDFESDQEIRWCPGCGDYSILAQTQKVLPELDVPREKFRVCLRNRLFKPLSLLCEHIRISQHSWPRSRDRNRS